MRLSPTVDQDQGSEESYKAKQRISVIRPHAQNIVISYFRKTRQKGFRLPKNMILAFT